MKAIRKRVWSNRTGEYIDIVIGSKLIITSNRLKRLNAGDIVELSKVGTNMYSHTLYFVGVEGSYNVDAVRKPTIIESRKLKLIQLSGDKTSLDKPIPSGTRKIDTLHNPNHVLVSLILGRLNRDKGRLRYGHNINGKPLYDSYDGMVKAIANDDNIFGITEKDFDAIASMSMKEILSKFITDEVKAPK